MGREITEFELNRYEYIRVSEELEILRFNIYNDYKNLLKKLQKELPKYSIWFKEDQYILDSYFDIYDGSMDITDPRKLKHEVTYKGVSYRLIGHKESQYKINEVIDNYCKGEE